MWWVLGVVCVVCVCTIAFVCMLLLEELHNITSDYSTILMKCCNVSASQCSIVAYNEYATSLCLLSPTAALDHCSGSADRNVPGLPQVPKDLHSSAHTLCILYHLYCLVSRDGLMDVSCIACNCSILTAFSRVLVAELTCHP